MQNLKNFFEMEVKKAAVKAGVIEEAEAKAGADFKMTFASQSNRPDLSDYQSNVALPLAKRAGKNPREVAEAIVANLPYKDTLYTASIAAPAFINFRLANSMLEEGADIEAFPKTGRTIVVDHGGPNLAKAMHVGHLRPAVIGESLKHIMRTYGDRVLGDVHFGDWGTPIGMLIAQMQKEGTASDAQLSIDEISALYVRAAASFKEDEEFKDKAHKITSDLQAGNAEYLKIWRMLHDVSIEDIKETYKKLKVDFDLWLGESDVNDLLPWVFKDLTDKGLAVLDDGAMIVRLPPVKGRERAPFILRKTDGAYTYAATDLATIVQRMEDFKPAAIIYVVDARQKEHFEAVFEVAKMAGYVPPEVSLEHIGFGTVNGPDGKPFKTREGGVMRLNDLLELALTKAREASSAEADLQDLEKIAYGAIKYQDLKSTWGSDYAFDTENFVKSEGKTGAYVQYAVVRINSILDKAREKGEGVADKPVITSPLERDLLLALKRYPEVMQKAYELREPSEFAGYAHILAQKFSSLYAELPILGEENEEVRASRLKLAEMTKEMLLHSLYLLGIDAPTKMLRDKEK